MQVFWAEARCLASKRPSGSNIQLRYAEGPKEPSVKNVKSHSANSCTLIFAVRIGKGSNLGGIYNTPIRSKHAIMSVKSNFKVHVQLPKSRPCNEKTAFQISPNLWFSWLH